MKNPSETQSDLIAHKVNVNLNVFRPLVMNWTGGKVDRRNIVAKNKSGLRWRTVKIGKKPVHLGGICNCISNSPIFNLGTRTRSGSLTLRRPGD